MKLIFIAICFVFGHESVQVNSYENESREISLQADIMYQKETVGILSKASTCLIQQLAWENIIILFDDTGEHIVQDMLMFWRETQFQIPVQMTNVDSVDSSSSFRYFLEDLYHSVPHLNFILVAHLRTVSTMITQVNDIDVFSNRTMDFRHRSKWIIISEESIKENLTTWAKNLENVAFISSRSMSGHLTNELKIFTIVRSSPGPSLMPIRFIHCNLTTDDVFPNIKYKYNRKHLIVVRTAGDPFSLPVFTNNTVTYEGYGIDILDTMAYHLNFTYNIIQPKDKQWGLLVNGTWNGIVGMLARREVDLQISSLANHEDRAKMMHFLQPPVFTQFVDVLYKRLDLYEDTWFTYVRPFKPMVFLCIGVSAAVFCLLYVILESCRPAEQSTKRNFGSITCQNILQLFNKSVFFTVASAAQRGEIMTRATSSNIIVASWRLFLIVTTAAYTANLVAELASKKSRVPFKTLGELVDNKDFTFGMFGTGIQSLVFKKTRSGDMKRAWTALENRAKTDPNILGGDINYHLQRVLKGKYGWIVPVGYGKLYRKSNCSLVFMKSPFNWVHVGFGVPNGSPYINDFERILSIMSDNGLLMRLQEKWFKTPCDHEDLESQSARTMGMGDIKGVFIFSAGGLGLAFIILILEVLYIHISAKK